MEAKKELARHMSNMEKTALEIEAEFLKLGSTLARFSEFLNEEPAARSAGEKCNLQTKTDDSSVKILRK